MVLAISARRKELNQNRKIRAMMKMPSTFRAI